MFAKRCIVTGGAGFIGSALVRLLIRETNAEVLVVDKLTYAGVPQSLKEAGLDPDTLASSCPRLHFLRADICDLPAMNGAFAMFRPDTVYHLAAETHVDRSIDGPAEFVRTNVLGTTVLLQAALKYWDALAPVDKQRFKFQHVSTDEVYGSLGDGGLFTEATPYSPHSPYSASKASSDHFVRAFGDTYGLPVVITNCSNNYGPYHFPEKLIPLTILNCFYGRPLPVYGAGDNVRDWLYVDDHARALVSVNEKGAHGGTYNIGGNNERTNLDVVKSICAVMDELHPRSCGKDHFDSVVFVQDRPGHDFRYAIDSSKIRAELGWAPQVDFESGIRRTVEWYLANRWWWEPILSSRYAGQRLGCRART